MNTIPTAPTGTVIAAPADAWLVTVDRDIDGPWMAAPGPLLALRLDRRHTDDVEVLDLTGRWHTLDESVVVRVEHDRHQVGRWSRRRPEPAALTASVSPIRSAGAA